MSCSDAKRCGVEIITAEKLVHNCTYPTISLNPYIRVPDAINLDGGYLTPCTAEASMRLLRRYGFIFQGADVLLLGRSERVGGATITFIDESQRNRYNRTQSHKVVFYLEIGPKC